MSSDYEFSDDDAEYYDEDDEMIDGTQDDEGLSALLGFVCAVELKEIHDVIRFYRWICG